MDCTYTEEPVADTWLPLSVPKLEPLVASEERLLDMSCVLVPVALVEDVDIALLLLVDPSPSGSMLLVPMLTMGTGRSVGVTIGTVVDGKLDVVGARVVIGMPTLGAVIVSVTPCGQRRHRYTGSVTIVLGGRNTHRLCAHCLEGLEGGAAVAWRAVGIGARHDAVDEGGGRTEASFVVRGAAPGVCVCNAVFRAGYTKNATESEKMYEYGARGQGVPGRV